MQAPCPPRGGWAAWWGEGEGVLASLPDPAKGGRHGVSVSPGEHCGVRAGESCVRYVWGSCQRHWLQEESEEFALRLFTGICKLRAAPRGLPPGSGGDRDPLRTPQAHFDFRGGRRHRVLFIFFSSFPYLMWMWVYISLMPRFIL